MGRKPVNYRMCLGCRTRRPKEELLRVAEDGRGAYLCPGNETCLKRALKSGAIDRALRRKVSKEEADEIAERVINGKTRG